jgi:hypothetical protein
VKKNASTPTTYLVSFLGSGEQDISWPIDEAAQGYVGAVEFNETFGDQRD